MQLFFENGWLNEAAILIIIILPDLVYSQLYIRGNSGINISDAQDQKYIFYDQNHKLLQKILVNDEERDFSFLNNMNLSYWFSDGLLNNFGVRFDYSDWTYDSFIEEFPPNEIPPINRIKQERVSYFVSLLRKYDLVNDVNAFTNDKNAFIYIGIGGGLVHSEVKFGADNIGVGFHLLSGVSFPILANLFLVGEFNFIIAPDVDDTPKPGWQVHTSGTKTPFRFGPHHDTRFFGLTFGFNYSIY